MHLRKSRITIRQVLGQVYALQYTQTFDDNLSSAVVTFNKQNIKYNKTKSTTMEFVKRILSIKILRIYFWMNASLE